jgi:hypothetical protein
MSCLFLFTYRLILVFTSKITPSFSLIAPKSPLAFNSLARDWVVPKAGLEPARVSPYAPQTYVSTNSTTSAKLQITTTQYYKEL